MYYMLIVFSQLMYTLFLFFLFKGYFNRKVDILKGMFLLFVGLWFQICVGVATVHDVEYLSKLAYKHGATYEELNKVITNNPVLDKLKEERIGDNG